jgi:hypothetical protein
LGNGLASPKSFESRIRSDERLHDPPVVHASDAVGVVEDPGVVSHDDDGAVGLDGVRRQELHHRFSRRVVESRGRLVAHDDARLVDQRAGEGDALLLSSGEFRGQRPGALFQPEPRKQRPGAIQRLLARHLGGEKRHRYVLRGSQSRKQVVLLEDEAEVSAPEKHALRAGEVVRPLSEDREVTLGAVQQAGDHAQERRLAAPAGPHEKGELAEAEESTPRAPWVSPRRNASGRRGRRSRGR